MLLGGIGKLCFVVAAIANVCSADSFSRDLGIANPLPSKLYPKARCLDGTQGRYYFRRGSGDGLTKFYLHQEGGGFCGSLDDCLDRSKGNLGSTSPWVSDAWGPTYNLSAQQSYFSLDRRVNPLLHNWNHVWMVYCDGAYFAGENATATFVDGTRLYFAGKHILDATLHHLSSAHDLFGATDVILGGCSAGAIATFNHLDYVANQLKVALAPQARVTGFPDSGFYLDLDYFEQMKVFPFRQQNISSVLSQECLQKYRSAPQKCLIAERNAVFVKTPLFAWQSKFDGDQLSTSFKDSCNNNPVCAMKFSQRLVSSVKHTLIATSTGHGFFVDGCNRHCGGIYDGYGDVNTIAYKNVTPLVALSQWYAEAPAEYLLLDQPAPTFPCHECCPPTTTTTTTGPTTTTFLATSTTTTTVATTKRTHTTTTTATTIADVTTSGVDARRSERFV